jgi:outer membrane receptor protein involved in Fe transport
VKRIYIFLLFALFPLFAYAQQSYTLKGMITYLSVPVADVVVVLQLPDETLTLITDKTGVFSVKRSLSSADSVFVSAYGEGYGPLQPRLTEPEEWGNIRVEFTEKMYDLPEVTATASARIVRKANKTIYKVSSGDYLKNAKAHTILGNVPSLAVSGNEVLINNREKAKIFIDGLEGTMQELESLDADDIDRIEVLSAPSASYGSELMGGVIHVIRKNRMEHLFKGNLQASRGLRLNHTNLFPSFAYQNKFLTWTIFDSYSSNNQNSRSELERTFENMSILQDLDRKAKGYQQTISTRLKASLSGKSALNLSGSFFQYRYKSNTSGSIRENEQSRDLEYKSKEILGNVLLNGVYSYDFSPASQLLVKGRLHNYRTEDVFLDKDAISTVSTIREYAGEAVYALKRLSLFTLPADFSAGYKNVSRNYGFGQDDFQYVQNLHSTYADIDFSAGNFSFYTSLLYEYTYGRSNSQKKNYDHFLPVVSAMYRFGGNLNLSFDYSRKILRPSAYFLNPNPHMVSPLYILRGNPDLSPQIRDNVELTLSKTIPGGMLSVNLFNHRFKQRIDETYTVATDGQVLNSYSNIGKADATGFSLGYSARLFRMLNVTVHAGMDYNAYSSDPTQTLISANSGYSFNGNLNLYTILPGNWSVNLSTNYRSRSYSLVQTLETTPVTFLSLNKNLFKDKLTLGISYNYIFTLVNKGYINSSSFAQRMTNTNRMTNLTFSVTYRFGKQFNDSFRNPAINSSDIETKR